GLVAVDSPAEIAAPGERSTLVSMYRDFHSQTLPRLRTAPRADQILADLIVHVGRDLSGTRTLELAYRVSGSSQPPAQVTVRIPSELAPSFALHSPDGARRTDIARVDGSVDVQLGIPEEIDTPFI